VSWFDVNNDGLDDLIIGAGKSSSLAVFENDRKGGFKALTGSFTQPAVRDQTTVLGWKKPDGQIALLIGSSNYEDGLATAGGAVREYNFKAGGHADAAPAHPSSTGPLALADFDGDGQLDLFVGGRALAGRWPQAADSRVYRFQSGAFQLDATNSAKLQNIGVVSSASCADLDGDGWPDLILACEWGPIRIFKNNRGALTEMTAQLGLDRYTGWWNGVAVGDLDADGKLDIIASNWGLNTPYRTEPARPLLLYYGDLLQRETIDIVESEYSIDATPMPLRPLDIFAAAIPPLRERYTSHRAFGQATIADIFGPYQSRMREVQATTLASTIFFNRGETFNPVALPTEAQFAPAFGVAIGDVDGDGAEDIFLAQNFFANQLEVSRMDAGRGLWLRNDGAGKFTALSGEESGVTIYGEQRGAALSDFNQDGRIDLAVGQNNGPTKLFVNERAKRGLAVTLRGPVGNPHGVGAQIRIQYRGGAKGPIRAIVAGSGYWSQNSATQILGLASQPESLWIRWPGGREQIVPVAENTWTLQVEQK
jgi:hypothetical protein